MRSSILLALTFITINSWAQVQPIAKKEPKVFKEHGRERVDPYYWLSNPQDPNVIEHLKAENAYVESYMKKTEGLQQKLFDEIISRIEQRYESLPTKSNGYWYYSRYDEGQQYPYYARKKGTTTAKEEIMLNVPEMAKGHQIFLLRGTNVSPDNRYLAYGVDTNGSRRADLYIKDLTTGKVLNDRISNTSGNYAWGSDSKTVFYVLNDHTVRAYRVMRHTIGTDPKQDEEVFVEKDSTFRVYIHTSKSKKFIFIHSGNGLTSEALFIDPRIPEAQPLVIQERQTGVLYFPEHFEGNIFHIVTNKNAVNFRVVTTPTFQTSSNSWTDLIPHNPDALLENIQVLRNYLVVETKEKGLTQIKVFDRNKKKWKNVPFSHDAYVANLSVATDEYDSDSIRYYFSSLAMPGTDYAYNLATGETTLLKRQKAGSFNPELYDTKRIWVKATDGTSVPVSLVYRKDQLKKDGSNPMYLYAYGSYGANSDPYFNSSIVSLLDRGFIYGIAHVRGGQEMGRAWYENARVLTKKNTFTDFIDAAQFLVNEKYTSADRLFANGGSAGGMLMGVVTNMRPDLFRGIIAEVPWMDVVTDMFNPNLPLTTLEYPEWGDPNKKDEYEYMLSWSPMDNIKPAKYPSILATGGLHDTQVPYFSPAKWVARIRENNLGNNPVLFKVNLGAGHGGESGRFERQKLTALKFAFVLDQLGWNEETRQFSFKTF